MLVLPFWAYGLAPMIAYFALCFGAKSPLTLLADKVGGLFANRQKEGNGWFFTNRVGKFLYAAVRHFAETPGRRWDWCVSWRLGSAEEVF